MTSVCGVKAQVIVHTHDDGTRTAEWHGPWWRPVLVSYEYLGTGGVDWLPWRLVTIDDDRERRVFVMARGGPGFAWLMLLLWKFNQHTNRAVVRLRSRWTWWHLR